MDCQNNITELPKRKKGQRLQRVFIAINPQGNISAVIRYKAIQISTENTNVLILPNIFP